MVFGVSGCVLCLTNIGLILLFVEMEGFSLEDDDMNNMFIMQEVSKSSQNGLNHVESDEDLFEFGSVNKDHGGNEAAAVAHYSDISDNDGAFEEPKTQ